MLKASLYCTVGNAGGKHEENRIKRELDLIPGVLSVSVSGDARTIAVDYDTTGAKRNEILQKIEKLGYQVADTRLENHIM